MLKVVYVCVRNVYKVSVYIQHIQQDCSLSIHIYITECFYLRFSQTLQNTVHDTHKHFPARNVYSNYL